MHVKPDAVHLLLPQRSSDMIEKTAKLNSIQAARAFAALLVVLHHLSLSFEQRVAGIGFLKIFDHFGFAGVDLFFVISGLVMVVTCQRYFGRAAHASAFLWRRITRIYPLYWIFTLLQLVAILLVPAAADRLLTAENIVSSFLLLPQAGYPILAPGWTLVYEMFFYLVFSLLFFIPRRFSVHFLTGWGLLTTALYASQSTAGMSDTTDLVKLPIYASPMPLEFLAGCLIGFLYNRQINCFGKLSICVGTALFVAGGWVVETYTDLSTEFGLTRVLVFGGASSLVLYGLIASEKSRRVNKLIQWMTSRKLVALGDASYSLYLSHLLVINAFVTMWSHLHATNWYVQAIYEAIVLATCIGFAIITFRLVERPILARSQTSIAAGSGLMRAIT
ncbi:MAG TPA: hypothetical protein DDZ51_23395 [Planctomycetaceae bacterium]|nr:hypothetical protein [Planctomycetaceae bacterium]